MSTYKHNTGVKMKRTIVDGSSVKEFASSEEKLVIILMALKNPPVRIEAEGNICTYYFDHDTVIETANKISCGNIEGIKIPLADLWASQNIWKINISRAKQSNEKA